MPRSRVSLAAAAAWLQLAAMAAAAAAAAGAPSDPGVARGRALLQINPDLRQFVQITVSLRGTCSVVLTAKPTLLNDVRIAAITDVANALSANPVGVANLTATLASLRAGTPNCTAVTNPVNGATMAGIRVASSYNGVSSIVVRDVLWNAARSGICSGGYDRTVWAQLTATLPAAFPIVYNNGSRLNPSSPHDAQGNPTFANTVPYAPVSPGPCDPVPSPSPSPSPPPYAINHPDDFLAAWNAGNAPSSVNPCLAFNLCNWVGAATDADPFVNCRRSFYQAGFKYAWVGGWRAVRQALLYNKALNGNASLLAPALGGIVGFCLPAPDTTLYVNVFDLCALEEAGGFTRVAPGPVSFSEILVNEYQIELPDQELRKATLQWWPLGMPESNNLYGPGCQFDCVSDGTRFPASSCNCSSDYVEASRLFATRDPSNSQYASFGSSRIVGNTTDSCVELLKDKVDVFTFRAAADFCLGAFPAIQTGNGLSWCPQNAPGSAALPFANFYGGLSGPEFIIPNDQTSASNLGANGGLANVVLNRPTPPPMP